VHQQVERVVADGLVRAVRVGTLIYAEPLVESVVERERVVDDRAPRDRRVRRRIERNGRRPECSNRRVRRNARDVVELERGGQRGGVRDRGGNRECDRDPDDATMFSPTRKTARVTM
jgi:hypothetical protein